MSIAPRTKDKRRFSREDVCFRCEIAGPDFEPAHALIVNISPMGCMIRCSREAEPDPFVSFTLPHAGRIEGRIVWAIGGRMGVEFAEEIEAGAYLPMLPHLHRPGDEMGTY